MDFFNGMTQSAYMAAKTAFVTGGTGFLGLNLVEQLVAQGWHVTVLHRQSSNLQLISRFAVELVVGDILNLDSLKRAIPEGVFTVFHLAADTSVWSRHDQRQTRVNVEGTRNVARAALAADAQRFVHTSTWMTYGLEQGDISEDSPQLGAQSWSNYGRTKFFAEEEVRATARDGLDAVILNPAHVMGRYDQYGWARLIIDLRKHWLPRLPPGSGTFSHALEVAKAHIEAAERGRSGQNYLLGGTDASLVEVFRTIGDVTGWPVPVGTAPPWLFRLAGRINAGWGELSGIEPLITPEAAEIIVARARIVSNRAQAELGYQTSSLHTMIEDCYRWLLEEEKI